MSLLFTRAVKVNDRMYFGSGENAAEAVNMLLINLVEGHQRDIDYLIDLEKKLQDIDKTKKPEFVEYLQEKVQLLMTELIYSNKA